jgi:hypothetical protein
MKKLFKLFLVLAMCLAFVGPAIAQTHLQVDLTFEWEQALSTDFYGWRLFYATTSGGPYTQLGSDIVYGGAPAPTYTSDEVILALDDAETTYYFVAIAGDLSDNWSGDSNEVAYTADFLGPNIPVQLRVTITPITP